MTAASLLSLISAFLGERTAADTAHSLSTERDMPQEYAPYSLHDSVSSQSDTISIAADGVVQTISRTANPNTNNNSVLSNYTHTLTTGSRFILSERPLDILANVKVNASKSIISAMDISVLQKDRCDVMLCEAGTGRFLLNTSACNDNDIPSIKTSRPFTITVPAVFNRVKYSGSQCVWDITPHTHHYMNFSIGRLSRYFVGTFYIYIKERDQMGFVIGKKVIDSKGLKITCFSFLSDNSIRVRFDTSMPPPTQNLIFHVDIKEGTYLRDLPVVMLSDTMGYVTSPGYEDGKKYPSNYEGSFYLSVEFDESLLINFDKFHIENSANCANDYLRLTERATKIRWTQCRWKRNLMARVFRHSVDISFHTNSNIEHLGFKIMFAILPRSQEPMQLRNKHFDCSVPSFHIFKPVFSCNLLVECEDGEDEEDCGGRKNDCGMKDTIDTGSKCYSLVLHQRYMTWFDAQKQCIRRGQKLATMEHPDDFRRFKAEAPPQVKFRGYFIGAQLMGRLQAVSITALYRNIWQWVDGSTVFSVQIHDYYKTNGACALYHPWLLKVTSISCHEQRKYAAFACEFHKHSDDRSKGPVTNVFAYTIIDLTKCNVTWNVSVVQCSSDHVTRDFLSCDFQSDCGGSYSVSACSAGGMIVPMFVCQRSRSTVHYTLVCDHMQHCSDNSDEDFCKYPECSSTSMKCRNGQCIDSDQHCNGKLDCYDGSDEVCQPKRYSIETTSPPGSIHLDGKGNFRKEWMNSSDKCPQTHFPCAQGFCLPIYLRCNGIADCVAHEDEMGCDSYRCRGFYRCRGSKTCLHPKHVCDGIPQCPEQDDELVCDLVCPDVCRCQGLAFVCTSVFSATSYLSLRYLDANGSNMTLHEVHDNIGLIALRVSKCCIISLPPEIDFPNLMELDLSWNELRQIHLRHFYSLKNLKMLVLTGNPLIQLCQSATSGSTKLILEHLDLSHTSFEEFNGSNLSSFPHIKLLNISWSKLRSIRTTGFQDIPRLEKLDLRGIRLINFPKTLLRHQISLKSVYSENYKLCCDDMLPLQFDMKNCHTTQDLLASCDDLLKSSSYRMFLWIFASLSLVGNVFSVGTRLYHQQGGGGLGSFSVFVTNLCVADFFMGVYLAIIGTADFVYRGHYLWRDNEWKNSAACHLAGFLSLLSSETSAFIICLITIDRFIVLRFPFSRLHFGRQSALFTCGIAWTMGIFIAIIPLLPVTSHWKFYSQTGICIPLPFTSSNIFRGFGYSFGVSILLNMVLFLLIAVGQAAIYFAVRANSIASSTSTQVRDITIARRLITVVVSDFLCWFPIGLIGLLASTGTSIPGYLNVAMAIFVLPVNSALNPFLYTFNLFMEKRKKAETEKLLKRLEQGRRDKIKAATDKSKKTLESADKTAVIQQIKTWIADQKVTPEDLLLCSTPSDEMQCFLSEKYTN